MTGEYLVAEYFNTGTEYTSFVTIEEAGCFLSGCHQRGIDAKLIKLEHHLYQGKYVESRENLVSILLRIEDKIDKLLSVGSM